MLQKSSFSILWLAVLAALALSTAKAQVSNYTFQRQTTTYIPVSQGNALQPDDLNSPVVPIGFPFRFNGQLFDSVNVAEKGWLWFGPGTSFVSFPHPIGETSFNGPVTGIVCAFGNELIPQLFDPGAAVLYKTTGSAPNRIFTVEWRVFTRIQPVVDGAADVLNFQIQFVESSNLIRMNYNCFAASWSPEELPNDISERIQVGLRGSGPLDFHVRTGSWGNSTQANQVNQTITFNDAIGNEPKNLRYVWTPAETILSIITGNIPSGNVCTSTPYFLPYTTTGTFPTGTQFVAQLSGPNGVFSANPTVVGQGTGATIPIQLPGTAIGNGYRLRVISQNPVVVGSVSLPFASQNCCNTFIEPFGLLSLCSGDSLVLTAGEGLSFEWMPGGQTTRSITVKEGGVYSVKVLKTLTCTATASVSVSTIPVSPLIVTANSSSLSPGQSAVLTANGGQSSTWSPPDGLSSTNGQTVIATPSQTTTYTATSILSSGCTTTGKITISVEGPGGNVAPVAIFPGTGTYDGPQIVGLSCTTPGSVIYYTTNGNIPLIGSTFTKIYSSPFSVLQSSTIRAMAVKPGMVNSLIRVAAITITNPGIVSTPVISPGGGNFSGSAQVSVSCATSGAQIWFTTNGNLPRFDVPNSFTKPYTGPFTIFESTTVRAVAVKSGMQNSPVVVASFVITDGHIVAPVQFEPGPGSYDSPQPVQILCETPDVQIWFTTNGNTPLTEGPNFFTKRYTIPFVLNQNTQLKAIAIKPGFKSSAVKSGSYFIAGQKSIPDAEIETYPNPSTDGIISLKWNPDVPAFLNGQLHLTVIDMKGKIWLTEKIPTGSQEFRMDLSQAGKGLFFARIVGNGFNRSIAFKLE